MTSNFDSKYVKFVNQVTSDESKNHVAFINRIKDLEQNSEMHRLLTAAVGMSAEAGGEQGEAPAWLQLRRSKQENLRAGAGVCARPTIDQVAEGGARIGDSLLEHHPVGVID